MCIFKILFGIKYVVIQKFTFQNIYFLKKTLVDIVVLMKITNLLLKLKRETK